MTEDTKAPRKRGRPPKQVKRSTRRLERWTISDSNDLMKLCRALITAFQIGHVKDVDAVWGEISRLVNTRRGKGARDE